MPKIKKDTSPVQPVLIDVAVACHILSCGRTVLYNLMKRGDLRSTKFGGKRVFSRQEVEDYARSLIEATS